MDEAARVEKFTFGELALLRRELRNSQMDSWQAAEVVSNFLSGRGYGVNSDMMRAAASTPAALQGSHEAMQSFLETVAYVM